MVMLVYSLLLTCALTLSTPWWAWRMRPSGRYREGLGGRLGRVPTALRQACTGKRVVWVHAVSVGEVLAATRLVAELRQTLGESWVIAVSTTTATGQHIARERLGAATTFWFPLDFAFSVRAYLRTLKPELLVLVESELWPRMLHECARARIPVAVVNARVSDRSFNRTRRLRPLWLSMAQHISLWLAQGDETAARLRQLGVAPERLQVPGNLKYDSSSPSKTKVTARLTALLTGRDVVVAGSTLEDEESLLLEAWPRVLAANPKTVLVLAPRHPERFPAVQKLVGQTRFPATAASILFAEDERELILEPGMIILLDTLGDLASIYALASAAFIGGSLVPKGGHNPLEAARFGVPVVMGPSYENFREIVEGMRAAGAISITQANGLAQALTNALQQGQSMGQRGQAFFNAQAGATARTVTALLELLHA